MPQAYTERSIQSIDISVQQAAPRDLAHQRAYAADPGGRFGAGPHAVHQRAEPRFGDAHEVADLVGEAATRLVAILRRREQRAEEKDEAVGILMLAHRLAQQLFGVAADLVHRATAFETIAFGPVAGQVDDRAAQLVPAAIHPRTADERASRARGTNLSPH